VAWAQLSLHRARNPVQRKFAGGKAYTALLDLKPGDEFESKLGKKQIRLFSCCVRSTTRTMRASGSSVTADVSLHAVRCDEHLSLADSLLQGTDTGNQPSKNCCDGTVEALLVRGTGVSEAQRIVQCRVVLRLCVESAVTGFHL